MFESCGQTDKLVHRYKMWHWCRCRCRCQSDYANPGFGSPCWMLNFEWRTNNVLGHHMLSCLSEHCTVGTAQWKNQRKLLAMPLLCLVFPSITIVTTALPVLPSNESISVADSLVPAAEEPLYSAPKEGFCFKKRADVMIHSLSLSFFKAHQTWKTKTDKNSL